ncbi:MAG: Dabb family protein [Gloeobacteraceae cyanobacterium ES-bin-316]|nr:Dabb family protein [Ferruginibacter sp.]
MQKLSRRNFLSATSKASLAGAALSVNMPLTNNEKMKNKFIHHVYFWLKNTGSLPDRDKLVEGLQKLSAVKTIKQFHIGKPANTSREVIDSSYAVSWMLVFANEADQAAYQTDSVHLKFIEDCSKLWSKVVVYDSVDAS